MHPTALKLQLPDPSALPRNWLLIAVAVALLVISATFINTLLAIPPSLKQEVDNLLASRGLAGLASEVNGRDVTLQGMLEGTPDRDALVDDVRQISGVRVVNDAMRESDPAEQSQLEALAFTSDLENLPIGNVSFDAGSSNLTSASAPVLDRLANLLTSYPSMRIRIAGHTDNTGRSSVNLRISRERAERVFDYLTRNGIEPGRLVAQGYGDSQPIADNSTDAGRAANRRIGISYID